MHAMRTDQNKPDSVHTSPSLISLQTYDKNMRERGAAGRDQARKRNALAASSYTIAFHPFISREILDPGYLHRGQRANPRASATQQCSFAFSSLRRKSHSIYIHDAFTFVRLSSTACIRFLGSLDFYRSWRRVGYCCAAQELESRDVARAVVDVDVERTGDQYCRNWLSSQKLSMSRVCKLQKWLM